MCFVLKRCVVHISPPFLILHVLSLSVFRDALCVGLGTAGPFIIYSLFFHLSSIFQVPSMCPAELSTWGKKVPRTQPLPSGSCPVGPGPSRGQPARRCRREPGGGARPAVSGAQVPLPGVCQARFQLLLPLTASAFHFHIIDYYLVKVFGLFSVIIPSFVFSL